MRKNDGLERSVRRPSAGSEKVGGQSRCNCVESSRVVTAPIADCVRHPAGGDLRSDGGVNGSLELRQRRPSSSGNGISRCFPGQIDVRVTGSATAVAAAWHIDPGMDRRPPFTDPPRFYDTRGSLVGQGQCHRSGIRRLAAGGAAPALDQATCEEA
jgi:hypothetical protein